MNKKILLRRPKATVKKSDDYQGSPPKTAELPQRTTSFKDELQEEIDSLDEELNINYDKVPKSIESVPNISSSWKVRRNECTTVSVWNIDEGFLPNKEGPTTFLDTSKETNQSNKTVRLFDKDNMAVQNVTQSGIYHHNLFEQIQASLPPNIKTVPRNIIIVQIAALLKRQLSDDMNKDVTCTVKKLPKKHTSNFEVCPKFEIILYENCGVKDKANIQPYEISEILQKRLLTTDHDENFFKNEFEEESDVSATDVSMMECHMTGKHRLNFSAHSISTVPIIKNIFPNLTIIDLSYNFLKIVPSEILQLFYLEELNLKNNPITSIPDNIRDLGYLRLFVCSFAMLSTIPASIFLCPNLQELDLSYNRIACIPSISSPQKLKYLDLSGNPIKYFKKTFTRLGLDKLMMDNTLIHPVFWIAGQFDPVVVDKSWSCCDLCGQPLTDFSNSSISFTRKFGNIIPIILSFCSSLCRSSFI